MKKWRSRLFTIIGVLLILVGIYFVFKPQIDHFITGKQNEEKIEQYDKKQADNKEKHKKAPQVPKDKSQLVGYIDIPSVHIKEPVYPGAATPEQLNRGVSLAEDDESLDQQNISIAGHTNTSGDYQFTNLHKVKKGAKVTFKVGDETRKYKMTSIKDVNPDEVSVLDEHKNKKDQLTLITCDDYNPQTNVWEKRTIFVAERVA
ncbi:class A sortase SrtA [Staphylococcus condimenti]|uniref:Class A sortase SrtA n=1 Tax=Staphylococcus condimenti TaxID=70255 RepID=A0AB37H114_9STAP|nr:MULTISPECIES: class A sortase SrtA [Staphylococcus]AMY06259.1 class A sortase SrtA [Staphylococcus condimenti]APR60140.1 class A sortase SrtA [Staphylococcus condimenti]MDK8645152.1 class A sortase SrtA [Staphylococcus condimenti]OFO99542.1 sortase A [Staphylococcus sp. HMSC065E08]PNZ59205.1 class A sortase SrtA [Staphylococcus condimenti]